ncbi:mCG1042682, isoform CRA_b, partial [Mus musculus]
RRCYRILLHTFIQSCFFFLHISPLFISPLFISPLFLYLPCLYISPSCFFFLHISPLFISPLFISPLFLYLPCLYISPVFISPPNPGSHPRTAGHATSPGTQLQLIRAAGANLHQIGFTCILVHLRSTQDVCVLYEEVRCKSYDLAAVPGAFGTAATPAP